MKSPLLRLAPSLFALGACSPVNTTRDLAEPPAAQSAPPPATAAQAPSVRSSELSARKSAPAAHPAPTSPALAGPADDAPPSPERDENPTLGDCDELAPLSVVSEPGGPKRHFSLDGYVARALRVAHPGDPRPHCVLVAWPPSDKNSAGQRVNVARRIRASWFRLLENTLTRIPYHHARLVRRFVIDNRPTEHGIAPFDRKSPDDARDGHTIWLSEHLFVDPNHWARGNYGSYYSYHVSADGRTAHTAPDDHDLFSPVLLHEIGHLVMYHLVNTSVSGIDATGAPSCAHTCGETKTCDTLPPNERERNCISPYCLPFRFAASTENWAEQYRFYFQSARTRELLTHAGSKCLKLLHELDHGSAPWLSGKPDISTFRPSRWASCGEKPCKPW